MKKSTVIFLSLVLFGAVNALTGYYVYLHQELLKDWQGYALAGAPLAAWLLFALAVALIPVKESGEKARPEEENAEKKDEARKDEKEPGAPGKEEKTEEEPKELYPKEVAVVQLLGLLQREGRLIDFLQEDIEPYEDAQIGAAVREVHRGCRQALKDALDLRPVLDAPEGSEVEIEEDFDPGRIRLIGNVQGEPPFRGIIRHCGWRFTKISLPKWTGDEKKDTIAPAEVEIV